MRLRESVVRDARIPSLRLPYLESAAAAPRQGASVPEKEDVDLEESENGARKEEEEEEEYYEEEEEEEAIDAEEGRDAEEAWSALMGSLQILFF